VKLLFLEMMSTPTNKLATYFGDDKPTSRSKVKCKGIGFACVKHCETYRARGFNLVMEGLVRMEQEKYVCKYMEQE